ncbi:MAG: M1 family metallopeptidase [Promethearchaeota archaeon]
MKKTCCILIIGIVFSFGIFEFLQINSLLNYHISSQESSNKSQINLDKLKNNHVETNEIFSHYNLSIIFHESTSSVEGNLTVDFYNNDLLNFMKLPFHLYLSGMSYIARPGEIEIVNVTKLYNPNIALTFEVSSEEQLLWVNLDETLESFQRVQFVISFIATIPDGGIDRANSHGYDYDQSRIFKFTSFYPMPCVYDLYDGWNTDPYLQIGDPFYYDMAYYDFFIEAPKNFIIAATGKLVERVNKEANYFYHFDPIYPVREVTFSVSKWFNVESTLINGVNVSTYYLPKSQFIWQTNALNYGKQALILFNDTFGMYPYPTFNVVEEYTHFGGMEYPCQVYITESVDERSNPLFWLELIIVHETGHQWWYNLIGNDEIDWGFLDEGLVCWSTAYYGEIKYGNWNYFQEVPYLVEVRNYYANEGLPSKINSSVYECLYGTMDYYYIAYHKTPLIFEKLRDTIGNSNFIAGLKQFFEEEKFDIALLSDLQQIMESVYGSSLDWFFFPWFDNHYLPKYNLLSCIYNVTEMILKITINDLNEPLNSYEYAQQIPITIYNLSNYIIYSDIVWVNSTTTLYIPMLSEPNKVRLEYTDDVLVQLDSPYPLYLEKSVQKVNGDEIKEKGSILGYNLFFFSLVCIIMMSSLIYKRVVKR